MAISPVRRRLREWFQSLDFKPYLIADGVKFPAL